jgi:hypothetical protein
MIRLLRGIIYGVAAGITAAFVLDLLDEGRRSRETQPPFMLGRQAEQKTAVRKQSLGKKSTKVETGDDLTDEARQALLDELGAQLQ